MGKLGNAGQSPGLCLKEKKTYEHVRYPAWRQLHDDNIKRESCASAKISRPGGKGAIGRPAFRKPPLRVRVSVCVCI